MTCTPPPQTHHHDNDLLFHVLYRCDPALMRSLILDSLDRLDDRAWPRQAFPRWDLDLLRCSFFLLLNKDMELKTRALEGLPPAIAPLDHRKAEALFLALESEVVRPFLFNHRLTPVDLVDQIKNLYLVS